MSEFAFAARDATPRKRPVQERSQATVAAILTATIQVLAEDGEPTTTRIAQVAGVSVGTLYQYFPNREALMVGAMAEHLEVAVAAVERGAAASRDLPLPEAAERVVRAFLAAKAERAEISRVLERAFGPDGSLDNRPIVAAATRRAQLAIAGLLGDPGDPVVLARAGVLCAALEGVVRAAIADDPARLGDPRWVDQVVALAIGALATPAAR